MSSKAINKFNFKHFFAYFSGPANNFYPSFNVANPKNPSNVSRNVLLTPPKPTGATPKPQPSRTQTAGSVRPQTTPKPPISGSKPQVPAGRMPASKPQVTAAKPSIGTKPKQPPPSGPSGAPPAKKPAVATSKPSTRPSTAGAAFASVRAFASSKVSKPAAPAQPAPAYQLGSRFETKKK